MRVLLFGTYDVRRHPRVGILGAGLAAAGAEILECNAPLHLDTSARVAILRQPWRLPWLVLAVARCWTQLVRRSRAVSSVDVVLVGYLGHFDVVLARLLFRRTTIALDHLVSASDTGQDRGESGAVKQLFLRAIDAVALRCADIVIVDTAEHGELLPPKARHRSFVAAVGAASEWFAARPSQLDTVVGRPLRVVFFGQYTPLHGAPRIGAALARLPSDLVEATMIGTGQDLAATRAAAAGAHIEWRDWVEPEKLPAVVASYDVCLGIFGTGPKARRVVPNKVFQAAAAGCAIVTSDTEPQRRLLADNAVFVPPGDDAALGAAVEELAGDRARVTELRQRAARLADEQFTPEAVTRSLYTRLRDGAR
jgi:glycosyltransferase involved in cell wall biosynthesis